MTLSKSLQLKLEFNDSLVTSHLTPKNNGSITTNSTELELEQVKKLFINYAQEYILKIMTSDGEISEWYRYGEILEDGIISKQSDFVMSDFEYMINYDVSDKVYISPEKKFNELIDQLDFQSLIEAYISFLAMLEYMELEQDPFCEFLFQNEDGIY